MQSETGPGCEACPGLAAPRLTDSGDWSLMSTWPLWTWAKIRGDLWNSCQPPDWRRQLPLGWALFCLFPPPHFSRASKTQRLKSNMKSVSVVLSWLPRRLLLADSLTICPSLGPLFPGVSITLLEEKESKQYYAWSERTLVLSVPGSNPGLERTGRALHHWATSPAPPQ